MDWKRLRVKIAVLCVMSLSTVILPMACFSCFEPQVLWPRPRRLRSDDSTHLMTGAALLVLGAPCLCLARSVNVEAVLRVPLGKSGLHVVFPLLCLACGWGLGGQSPYTSALGCVGVAPPFAFLFSSALCAWCVAVVAVPVLCSACVWGQSG